MKNSWMRKIHIAVQIIMHWKRYKSLENKTGGNWNLQQNVEKKSLNKQKKTWKRALHCTSEEENFLKKLADTPKTSNRSSKIAASKSFFRIKIAASKSGQANKLISDRSSKQQSERPMDQMIREKWTSFPSKKKKDEQHSRASTHHVRRGATASLPAALPWITHEYFARALARPRVVFYEVSEV